MFAVAKGGQLAVYREPEILAPDEIAGLRIVRDVPRLPDLPPVRRPRKCVEIVVAGGFDHHAVIANAIARMRQLLDAEGTDLQPRVTIIHEACHHTTDWDDPFGGGQCQKFRRPRIRVRPALRRAARARAHVLLFADIVETGWLGWWFVAQDFAHYKRRLHAFAFKPANTKTVSILHKAATRTGGTFDHISDERDAARIFDNA